MGEVYVEGRRLMGLRCGVVAMGMMCVAGMMAQVAGVAQTPAAAAPSQAAAAAPVVQGGTIEGRVVAGVVGKAGGVPLPGVAITATNTLTGKRYATSTDIDGAYAMSIPRNGRYVVRAELAGFAAATNEVVLNGVEAEAAQQSITIVPKATDFGLELASRAAADEARQASSTSAGTNAAQGLQGLSLSAGEDAADASKGSGNAGATLPTMAGVGDGATDSVTVTGQTGQTNGLANFSEDEIRQRVEDAVAQGRASGMIPQGGDPTNAIVGMLGGMMGGGGGGGFGGPGGGRGGPGGGGGGRGGGSGAFRNFNPAQPHGSIFYQGGNSALNSAPWSPDLTPVANPSAFSNRYGVTIAASPYIPGLTKPNTKQFMFLNLTGQKNLNAFLGTGRVPTALEREGDFSASELGTEAKPVPAIIYDPKTGLPLVNDTVPTVPGCTAAQTCIQPQAMALLNYYPLPNIPTNVQGYNYQTVSNAGMNNVAINARYVRTLGGSTATPFGNFGGGGGRRGAGNSNAPPSLRQNINLSYNYSHSASDQRNIFLPLGGATESGGNAVNAGYTISYGRLSNNASVTWNRLNAETRNYFTNTANDPSATAGLTVPNNAGGFANPQFYNGLAAMNIANFTPLSNTSPSQLINQTISFSDFVAWRKKKHNMRYGLDVRRVHADSIGGNTPLGSYTFTGYATASPTDQGDGQGGQTSGDGFADFLLGLPQSTNIQAGLYKTYLRENVYDWYATDDFRVTSNWTLNYGLRYEYFGPYSEKDGRLVNLTGVNGITPVTSGVGCVTPDGLSYTTPAGTVTCASGGSASLVNPDRAMYAPRFGFAYRPKIAPKLLKDTVVRGGYGINYNTGQYAIFARSLSHQEPFSITQTNDVPTPTMANMNPTPTGCTTNTTTTTGNMTLANGFGCSTTEAIQNNFAVNKNYRLGMVQIYNLNIQRTIPLQIVLNIGYAGSTGRNLDVVGSPNGTPNGTTTPGVAPFDYDESAAGSRSNQLVISAQKRQTKGIALGATYTYSHAIDNASGVAGVLGTPVQNLFNLREEEGNSSFDQRHSLTGNWLFELPFGPNRAYLNKGGVMAKVLDGYSLSGTFTLASGNYFTPVFAVNEEEASSGNVYQQRPDRDLSQPLKGPGTVNEFFNTNAFVAPAAGQYGTASQGSIEGPGTVSVNASLSRTVQLGETRSFEARVTATNVFNTVQYSGINTTDGSNNFGAVTSAATMRTLLVQARYRF
jgi:trimeric autotransporter adhesin